jgi:molybdate transport system substrate-binding protein
MRLGIFFLALFGSVQAAADVTVAVAANFFETATRIVDAYQKVHSDRIVLVRGSSGKHYAQIINGAPYDLYLSADAERPARLAAEGRGVPGSLKTYAIGRLALWSRDRKLGAEGLSVLRELDYRYLAIANPELAPYGAAARDVLRDLGLWDEIQPRLLRGENIAQAFQFAHSGNAELGFVAVSQIRGVGKQPGSAWIVPDDLHRPVAQKGLLIANTSGARRFFEFLTGAAGRRLILSAGYDLPPPGEGT